MSFFSDGFTNVVLWVVLAPVAGDRNAFKLLAEDDLDELVCGLMGAPAKQAIAVTMRLIVETRIVRIFYCKDSLKCLVFCR